MIDWKPFSPKALDVINHATARLVILHGAVRSGKTFACNVVWLKYLATGPQGDLLMAGKTRDTLQRNVLNTLFDIVGPKNYHWVDKQAGELNLLGRRIYCVGAANEEAESKIRGATFAGALCDEVSLYPENFFTQLMARLSIPGAQCFVNTNPDSPGHWFYTKFLANKKILDKQVWKFYMEDNLSLSATYIANLKSEYSGVWYERMINGRWVAAEGRIYDMFDPEIHVATNAVSRLNCNPNALTWVVGCDYGTSTVMSWGLYAIAPNGCVVKAREFYYDAVKHKRQKTDAEFGAEFQQWLNGLDPWMVYCDPSASSWKAELRQRGYRVRNADNDVINGIRQVASMLTARKYLIDASCVNTISEYQRYVWDDKAQKVGVDKPLKQWDHACVVGSTLVWTTEGKRRIDELVGTEGVAIGYDFNSNKFVEREFFNVRKTRFQTAVFRVTLKDGTSLIATQDHKVCTVDGWKSIDELTQNDSVGVVKYGIPRVQWSKVLQKLINWLLGKSKRNT